MDILDYSAVGLSTAIKEGRVTAVAAMERVLARIDEVEKNINAYVTVDKAAAILAAEKTQKRINAGTLNGPLAGVPMAVKDNICTAGMRTTCASGFLESFVPSYSAEVIKSLEKAGAVLIGKANMDEFAMGSTTETSAYGITKNPWNLQHVAGGSSGGSAAAVAARECFFALGSDTGGSVRQPAAFCGVVGMKPTYGMVSRYGLVAYASSLDQIGPLTGNVSDCAAVLEAISAHDVKDSTSIECENTAYTKALNDDVRNMKIGIPKEYLGDGLDEDVRKAVLASAEAFAQKGASVEEFDLNIAEYAIPAYYTIASAEASSNLERFDGIKYGYRTETYDKLHGMYKKTRSEGFGTEVKRRLMLGSFVLSAGYYDEYYLKALKVRAMLKNEFNNAFKKYDLILGPVAPSTAPKIGESLSEPMKMYLSDIYTISANLAGIPAISIPCGRASDGLPIGLQLMADCFQEKKLLQAAYTYEKLCGGFENVLMKGCEKKNGKAI